MKKPKKSNATPARERRGSASEKLKQTLRHQTNFFADASHELRTPLTIIKGNLDLLYLENQKNPLSEPVLELLNNINTEMKRMTHLLSDITFLNYSDSEHALEASPSLKSVDLAEIIKDIIEKCSKVAREKKVAITIGTLSGPCEVAADYENLKRGLGEIVFNAVHYNSTGGKVNISLEKNKNHACFTVSDTGIGIGEEVLPNIFDRFFRTHPARGRGAGSGLGLAVAKRVISDHNGSISVDSETGKGSIFMVKLPLLKN